jgi:hypothetical protein
MDWIEQLFGFSPDGGDGTTEALIVVAACAVIACVIYMRVPAARRYVGNLFRSYKTRQ